MDSMKFYNELALIHKNKPFCSEILVVYHLHQKPIWFQTVQMERNNCDWKIPFGARAFHFPYDRKKTEIDRKGPGARWKTQQNVNGTK